MTLRLHRFIHGPLALLLLLLTAVPAWSRDVTGALEANGKAVRLTHALALEVDSDTEPGYLDILVVLSDRELTPEQARSQETLEKLASDGELSAVRLLLDPDCKVKQIAPYHPSFKVFLVNAESVEWTPSAYDETVAGRLRTGRTSLHGESWSYDLTFEAPIVLDPEAETVGD